MRILVTGGAGFIGSSVADAYVEAGHEVAILDDLSGGKRENLNPKAAFHHLDVQSPEVEKLFADFRPEVLNHHAAQMDVRKSVADPIFDAKVNLVGLLNLLESGRRHGLKQVIFASSGGTVYGEQERFPAAEDDPKHPICPYGITKLTTEHYLYFYNVQYGLRYVAFRYGNVFGPRQNPHGEAGVVAIFAEKLLRGEQPVINGDGKQSRDYVFIGDLVRANVAALSSDYCGPLNIGTGRETDVNQIFHVLRKVCDSKADEQHGPAKPGESKRSVVDPSRAAEVLGWRPQVSFEEGIARTVAYFREKLGK
jgi:UDP-glucose 4-epimerase